MSGPGSGSEAPGRTGDPAPDRLEVGRTGAEPLAPKAPDSAAFRLAADPPRVMRLSRKALAIIGVATGLGIGGALIYALQPQRSIAPANLIDTDHGARSDVVTSQPGTYDKVPKLGPPLPGDLGRPILNAQNNGQFVPVPAMGPQAMPGGNPRAVAADQARERGAQERATAISSRLFLPGASVASSAANAGVPASTAANPSATAPGANGGASSPRDSSGQAGKRAFLEVPGNRATASTQQVVAPSSPYVLQAGAIVPAALITGIRSDLPGQITAQVTENVYDSPTGRVLLIPQGSRLIGEYDAQVSAGQTRLLLAWDRLILPGGRSILLDRQPGADASGYAGLEDKVNYHWGNMLRAAAISTALGVGTQLATNNNDPLVQALRYGTQDTVNQTGKQIIQRELGVAPTLTIRPGYPLRVIITRDLVIEPEGKGP